MKKRVAAVEAAVEMKSSWIKGLLVGCAAFLFALMAIAPTQLQATTAEQAYNQGQAAGAKAHSDDAAPEEEEEEEEGGCCGGGG